MNYEIRNVAEKIADYADIEKQFLLTRVRLLNIIGLITGSVSIILNFTRLPEVTVFYTVLRDVMAGFTVGTLICTLLYITGVLEQVREKTGKAMTILVYVAFAIVVVCLLIAALYPQTR